MASNGAGVTEARQIEADGPVPCSGGPYPNPHATRAPLDEARRLGISPRRMVCTGARGRGGPRGPAAVRARPDEAAAGGLGRRSFAALAAGLLAGCSTLRATPPVTPTEEDVAWSWQEVLRARVDERGRVDFRRLAAARGPLDNVVAGIARRAPGNEPAAFPTRRGVLAFHVNAYNALAMYAVLRAGIPAHLDPLDRLDLFRLTEVVVGGRALSLRTYKDEVIRPLGDARVHFALNDMAVSSPRLPREPFTAAGLDEELDRAAREFFTDPRNVRPDPARRVVRLSGLLDRYRADFPAGAPGLIAYANRYRPRGTALPPDRGGEFLPFDWTLNAQPAPGA